MYTSKVIEVNRSQFFGRYALVEESKPSDSQNKLDTDGEDNGWPNKEKRSTTKTNETNETKNFLCSIRAIEPKRFLKEKNQMQVQ